MQRLDAGQCVQNGFRHAFAKIALILFRAHVAEREYGDRWRYPKVSLGWRWPIIASNTEGGDIEHPGECGDKREACDRKKHESTHRPVRKAERLEGHFANL